MASCDRDALSSRVVVERVVAANVVDGEGLFAASLRRHLARHSVSVPFVEHDLLAELRGAAARVGPADERIVLLPRRR